MPRGLARRCFNKSERKASSSEGSCSRSNGSSVDGYAPPSVSDVTAGEEPTEMSMSSLFNEVLATDKTDAEHDQSQSTRIRADKSQSTGVEVNSLHGIAEKQVAKSPCHCIGWINLVPPRKDYIFIGEFFQSHRLFGFLDRFPLAQLEGGDRPVRASLYHFPEKFLPAKGLIVEFLCVEVDLKDSKRVELTKVLNIFKNNDDAVRFHQLSPTDVAVTNRLPSTEEHCASMKVLRRETSSSPRSEDGPKFGVHHPAQVEQLRVSSFTENTQPVTGDISVEARHFIETHGRDEVEDRLREAGPCAVDWLHKEARMRGFRSTLADVQSISINPMSLVSEEEFIVAFAKRRCGGQLPPLVGPYALFHLTGMLAASRCAGIKGWEELERSCEELKGKNRNWTLSHDADGNLLPTE